MNKTIPELIGIAMSTNDYPMLAMTVLAHASSQKMGKPAIRAMANVAFGKPGTTDADRRLILRCAKSIMALEMHP